MIFFLLSLICSTLVSVFMRLSEKYISNNLSTLACNYAVCSLVAFLYTGTTDLLPNVPGLGLTLGLGFVSGILFLGAFMLLQWNMYKNGVSLPSTFMKLGVVVPTVMALTLFGEKPTFVQIAGIILVLVSILMMRSEKGSAQVTSYASLIALLLVGGMASAMTKVYDYYGVTALENHFLFYNFAVAFLLCVVLCVLRGQRLAPADALFGVLVGVPNYFSTLFLLMALETVPAIVAYPASSVGSIVLILLCGRFFFRERLTKKQLIAIGVILVSLVLLNL